MTWKRAIFVLDLNFWYICLTIQTLELLRCVCCRKLHNILAVTKYHNETRRDIYSIIQSKLASRYRASQHAKFIILYDTIAVVTRTAEGFYVNQHAPHFQMVNYNPQKRHFDVIIHTRKNSLSTATKTFSVIRSLLTLYMAYQLENPMCGPNKFSFWTQIISVSITIKFAYVGSVFHFWNSIPHIIIMHGYVCCDISAAQKIVRFCRDLNPKLSVPRSTTLTILLIWMGSLYVDWYIYMNRLSRRIFQLFFTSKYSEFYERVFSELLAMQTFLMAIPSAN